MFKTPVSILEELMVTKRQASPDYSVEIHSDGIQGILFKCTVTVGSIQASGYASRKKDAKQHAAKNVLEMLGYRSEVMSDALGSSNSKPQNPNGCIKRIPLTNYVGKLNEIANTYQKPYPIYHEEPVPIRGKFLTRCSFLQYVCDGYGYNKKDSKQDAARNMLEIKLINKFHCFHGTYRQNNITHV
ncbi:hypothetical protein NQ315_013188 [Exocentrus adspersus]|uniref:DRBM domain-containing protein n=1 Tax=Exocentrus adspersus TaxID=1586481 RepID=A0AAV8VDF8_9CUCU|nr:hypothetical protein NQ315_013188 [Exocentrus adspersus]